MFTTVTGLKTHYQRIGRGPTLVLLHGWGCDWQIWSPVISLLSEHFQLVIPDLPAFGQSENPSTTWNSTAYIKWLTAFLTQTTQDQPIILIGHSFGGKLAALLAATHQPRNLNKLILVDASGLPVKVSSAHHLQKQFLSLIPSKIKKLIPLPLQHRLLRLSNSSTDYFLANPAQRKIFQAIINEDISPQLQHIKTSTLIIWGTQDQDTPIEHATKFHQFISNSQLSIFKQSGHFPFIDQPQAFVDQVRHFINHG